MILPDGRAKMCAGLGLGSYFFEGECDTILIRLFLAGRVSCGKNAVNSRKNNKKTPFSECFIV